MTLFEQFPTAQQANLKRQERMLEKLGQIAFGGLGFGDFSRCRNNDLCDSYNDGADRAKRLERHTYDRVYSF